MKSLSPYIFIVGLFLALVCTNMTTVGMFKDGLVYASVAENLANRQGSIWHLSYTATEFPQFYQHPPLMMAMQAGWMKVFGTGIMSVKGYCLIVAIVISLFVLLFWRKVGGSRRNAWLPLVILLMIPPVTSFAFANVLESTMTMFVLGAVLCVLVINKREMLWHAVGGLLLAGAFLVKGFTGLYPLALPFLLWVLKVKEQSFGKMLLLTVEMTFVAVAPIMVMYYASGDVKYFFDYYFEDQLVDGLGWHKVSRVYIVGRFFAHTAIVSVITALLLFVGRKNIIIGKERLHTALALYLLALCGVLPMMISTKQNDFYILTTYPIVAVAAAYLVEPFVEKSCGWVRSTVAMIVSFVMFVAGITLNAHFYGTPGRDTRLIDDMNKILPQLREGEIITVAEQMDFEYELHGYYYKMKHVSLDWENQHHHMLLHKDMTRHDGYLNVNLGTEEYELYVQLKK